MASTPRTDDLLPSHPGKPYFYAGRTRVQERNLQGSIPDGEISKVKFSTGLTPIEIVSVLPSLPDADYPQGSHVFLTTDNKLYRSTGSAWTAAVATVDLTGTISTVQIADGSITTVKIGDAQVSTAKLNDGAVTTAKIGDQQVTTSKIGDTSITQIKMSSGLRVPVIVASLPTLPDAAYPQGSLVVLTTDNKLYRSTGSTWTVAIPTADLTGTISTAQLANGAVTTVKIGDAQVSTANLIDGSITTAKIGDQQVIASKLGDATITQVKMASGLRVPVIVASLPTLPDAAYPQGSTVVLTTDNKLYRSTGAAWTVAIPTVDLTGTIATAQIANNAVTMEKVAAAQLDLSKLTATLNAALSFGDARNLLYNAGFEQGQTYWGSPGVVTTNSANAHTGNKYLLLSGAAATYTNSVHRDDAGADRYFEVNPGDVIYFSGWLYRESGDASIHCVIAQYDKDQANPIYAVSSNVTSSGSWTQSTLTLTIPAGVKYIRFYCEVQNNGTVTTVGRWDDLLVLRQTPGSDIVSRSIAADRIVTGALTANEIAAATITGAKIAAGTIAASNLIAGTITANEIAAATITGAKIAAGTITATQIASATLLTTNLIAGFQSFLNSPNPLNGIKNFGFEDGATYWQAGTGITVVTNSANAHSGNRYLEISCPVATYVTSYSVNENNSWQYFEVSPGDVVYVGGWNIRTSGDAPVKIGLESFDKDKAHVAYAFGSSTGSSWTQITATYTVPSNVKYVSMFLQVGNSGTVTTIVRFDDVFLTVQIPGAGIVANSITANQIAAATITGAKIAADTIVAGNIAAGAIGASELAAGSVVAGKIAAGTIVAADIAAATITATQIAAATITGSLIAADTIVAGNIAAGAIGASEIAAGAVVAGKIAASTIVAADIAAATITGDKLVASTITATQIATNAITADKILAGAVTAAKLSVSTLDAITANLGTVTAGTISTNVLVAANNFSATSANFYNWLRVGESGGWDTSAELKLDRLTFKLFGDPDGGGPAGQGSMTVVDIIRDNHTLKFSIKEPSVANYPTVLELTYSSIKALVGFVVNHATNPYILVEWVNGTARSAYLQGIGNDLRFDTNAGGASSLLWFDLATGAADFKGNAVRTGALTVVDNYLELRDMTAPGNPGSGDGRLYIRNNGTGNYEFVIKWGDGSVDILATGPTAPT
jgi:hypothetical protein